MISRMPYMIDHDLPLKDALPEEYLGPFAEKTAAQLSAAERQVLLNDFSIAILSPEEVREENLDIRCIVPPTHP